MYVLRAEGFDYFLYYPAKGHSPVRDINQAMKFETEEFALSYAGTRLLRHVYKEAVQVKPAIATQPNTLAAVWNNACEEMTDFLATLNPVQPEMEELDDLSLADLFTLADGIGDKYLTDEEIAERDRELAEAFALIDTESYTPRMTTFTPQELIAAANHDRIKSFTFNTPISIGSEKQIAWAKRIACDFLYDAHSWGFKAEQIEWLFANRGRYAKFWIDNRCQCFGEGTTRIAVEKELEVLARELQHTPRTNDELRKLAKRF